MMKLSKHEQRTLVAKPKENKPKSMRQQILMYPGRCVALTTVDRRMKQRGMNLHDACTTPAMNFKG